MSRNKSKPTVVDLTHDKRYQKMQQHLKLQGKAPATVQSYTRALRLAILYFGDRFDSLTREDLSEYYGVLLSTHSISSLIVDECALKFYARYVLQVPWVGDGLLKVPRSQKLPDIVSVNEMQSIIDHTRHISYRVYFFTTYSMGLRLNEGLRLTPGDIDAERGRVHIRQSKNRKDRLVPLPAVTLKLMREFWSVHRNPQLLFPSRIGGASCAAVTKKAMDTSGIQKALKRVGRDIGLKKTLPRTACATVTPLIC